MLLFDFSDCHRNFKSKDKQLDFLSPILDSFGVTVPLVLPYLLPERSKSTAKSQMSPELHDFIVFLVLKLLIGVA